jgi:hypothetical protein
VLGGRLEEGGEMSRVVGEVGVHDDHAVGAALERAREAREVRLAEPLLARPVQHLDSLVPLGEPVGQPARAVGRGVVHHEQPPVAGGRLL